MKKRNLIVVVYLLVLVAFQTSLFAQELKRTMPEDNPPEKALTVEERLDELEGRVQKIGETTDKEELQISEIENIVQGKAHPSFYIRLGHTAVVVLVGYLLIFILVRVINRSVKDVKAKYTIRKNIIYITNILIILFIFFLWVQKLSSLTIFLGVAGAGVALALQEALLSIAGWFLIILRHPFEVGDRIELGGVKGDVIDIRMFQTSLLEMGNWVEADQSTGRIVNIPNSKVFKSENYNYSRGFEFIWNEIEILVTFESNWRRGEEIMLEHANSLAEGMESIVKKKIQSMTKRYMIFYDKLTPIVYTDIKDSGVRLTLRYLTEAKKRRSTQDILCRDILNDFEKEKDVNFAYTTYRIVKS